MPKRLSAAALRKLDRLYDSYIAATYLLEAVGKSDGEMSANYREVQESAAAIAARIKVINDHDIWP